MADGAGGDSRQWWTMWPSTVCNGIGRQWRTGVSSGKLWWLATIDSDKWGGRQQWMVANSGRQCGCRRQAMAVDGASNGKRWWLATTDGGKRGKRRRWRWQQGGWCGSWWQLVAVDDGNQKWSAKIDGGPSGSWWQMMVDGSDEWWWTATVGCWQGQWRKN